MSNDDASSAPVTEAAPAATKRGRKAKKSAGGGEFGRYTRAQLEMMQGKRGRKPPEFYVLFPEKTPGKKPGRKPGRKAKAGKAVAKPAKGRRAKTVLARSPKVAAGGLLDRAHTLMAELAQVLKDPILRSYLEASEHDRRVIAAAVGATKQS